MPITEFLERNARLYPNDVCLVEINPEIKKTEGLPGKSMSLLNRVPKPATAVK